MYSELNITLNRGLMVTTNMYRASQCWGMYPPRCGGLTYSALSGQVTQKF
ncbi:MAG: hypothetical protein LBT09_01520 [Planctomycetaceae bacterium]|nr:hypothetical protein [Planctomycetaceae bacterium]